MRNRMTIEEDQSPLLSSEAAEVPTHRRRHSNGSVNQARQYLLINVSALNITRQPSGSLWPTILMGLSFMTIFTAFNTNGIISEVVIDSIKKTDPTFSGSGYVSLAVIYGVFATFNWLAPSCLSVVGPRLAMVVGSLTYVIFIGAFMVPQTWLLYVTSSLVGAGAALLWTAQGNYLTLISDDNTISRNSGVFWALLQCSMLFGNLFVFFQFRGQQTISVETQHIVFGVLTGVCSLGVVFLMFLPHPSTTRPQDVTTSAAGALKAAMRLFGTREMLLLTLTFLYTGIELSFFSGVYSACISFTLRFADSKRLVGLSGMLIGVGEIVGGATFGILGTVTNKWGRDPIVILGFLVHIISFFLIFLNLPGSAPLGETTDLSYLAGGTPSEWLALFCSLLLGFGDACFNTQLYSLLGSMFASNSASAFAIFKFVQSLAAAVSFFYSTVLQLQWQLLLLVLSGAAGTTAFCRVEWQDHRHKKTGPGINKC